jgi:predicted methyltransferase
VVYCSKLDRIVFCAGAIPPGEREDLRMSRGTSATMLLLTSACSILLTVTVCWAQTQPPPAVTGDQRASGSKKKVDPAINAQFHKADVKEFIKRFESTDREVYVKRREIVAALELKAGMAVADLGAGTGLFTRLIADAVGPKGRVYAVDISKEFLAHIAKQAHGAGQSQVITIQGSQESTNLAPRSVDLVFLCDVYHHLENHQKMLASIHESLRPGGVLVLVEFDRTEGKSSEFVLKHIRASQAEFRAEIESAGFRTASNFRAPVLKEIFVARFRKAERVGEGRVKKGG